MAIKICAISDMHGNLNFNIDACNLLLVCGDIVSLGAQTHKESSINWFEKKFFPWVDSQPCDKVIIIGGNHDRLICEYENEFRELVSRHNKLVYLSCEIYDYKGVRIYGTPMCKIFGNWWFMYSDEYQDKKYAEDIEKFKDIDIVISHDSPYGVSDILLQQDWPWCNGKHIGNMPLRRFVENTKPKLLFHGHLHSTNHFEEKLGDTSVYNVSLLNENYERVYKPLYIDFEK